MQKSTFQKIASLFNVLFIAVYRYFRDKPSTTIDFVNYWGEGEKFGLAGLPAWKKTIRLDKLIDECIQQYSITEFKNRNLYELGAFDLNQAFILIRHGMVKQSDFKSDKPLSQVTETLFLTLKKYYLPKEIEALSKNLELRNKARRAATTQEEYNTIHSSFISYERCKLIQQYYTRRIQNAVIEFGTTHYLEQNLFEINDVDLLEEALDAAEEADFLIYSGIETYKGKSIRDLSLFEIEQANLDTHDDSCIHFGFNETRRVEYLEEKLKDETEDHERQLKTDQKELERLQHEQELDNRIKAMDEKIKKSIVEYEQTLSKAKEGIATMTKSIEDREREKRNAAARERRAAKKAEAMREMNKQKSKPKAKPAKATTTSSRKKAMA